MADGAIDTVGTTIIARHLSVFTGASLTRGLALGNLHMNGNNPLLATVEGLILTRALLGFTGSAVTAGTGIVTPWETIRDSLNAKCGTVVQSA